MQLGVSIYRNPNFVLWSCVYFADVVNEQIPDLESRYVVSLIITPSRRYVVLSILLILLAM